MLQRFLLIACCIFASNLGWADDAPPDHHLTLLTENYGNISYSINGRDFEHHADQIGGTSTEFLKKMLARAEIPYKMKMRDWMLSYERALSRPNYGIFTTAKTEEREDLFEWIGPIAKTDWAIFVKKGSSLKLNSLDDIRGLRIGGYKGASETEYVQSNGIEVSVLMNDTANAHRLSENLIDAWISSDSTAWEIAEKAGYPDIERAFVIRNVDLYLALNKNTNPQWLNQLRTAFAELVAENELNLAN